MATTDNNDVDRQEDEAPLRRAAQNDVIPMEGEAEEEDFKSMFVGQMVRSVGGEFGLYITTENVEACVSLMESHREEICNRLMLWAPSNNHQLIHRHALEFPFRLFANVETCRMFFGALAKNSMPFLRHPEMKIIFSLRIQEAVDATTLPYLFWHCSCHAFDDPYHF